MRAGDRSDRRDPHLQAKGQVAVILSILQHATAGVLLIMSMGAPGSRIHARPAMLLGD